MAPFKITPSEYKALSQLAVQTHDATILRRTQALLWLAEEERVIDVAERLNVSRQVVYQWIDLYRREISTDLATRLAVGERSGRPVTAKGIIDPFIDEVIDHDPRTYGYNSTVWTASLICQYLKFECGLMASQSSVRLAICRLRIKWKRPRHHLSLRDPNWRQAKGGLKRG